jgi:hypothetical protein
MDENEIRSTLDQSFRAEPGQPSLTEDLRRGVTALRIRRAGVAAAVACGVFLAAGLSAAVPTLAGGEDPAGRVSFLDGDGRDDQTGPSTGTEGRDDKTKPNTGTRSRDDKPAWPTTGVICLERPIGGRPNHTSARLSGDDPKVTRAPDGTYTLAWHDGTVRGWKKVRCTEDFKPPID